MSKLLSIIIPVYNQIEYLETCINSVTKQNADDIEIILVDDGSNDGSGQICDEYEKKIPNIQVVHKKNGGLSSARNEGILKASGEYFLFLDSDDELAPNAIMCLKDAIKKYSPDMALFDYCYKREDGYRLGGTGKVTVTSKDHVVELLVKNQIGNQICFKAYKRTLFEEICFPEGRNYEDIATFYKLLLLTEKNVVIDSTLYIYNLMNAGSITQSFSAKNLTDMYRAINEFASGLHEQCSKTDLGEYLEYYKRNIYIYIYLKSKNCRKELETLRNVIGRYLWKNKRYDLKKFKYYSNKRRIFFYVSTLLHRWS